MTRKLFLIKENLEAYKKYLTQKRNCIVCNSKKYTLWARYGSYRAVKCERCGFVWINPSLNQQGLNKYYQDYIGMRFKDKVKTKQRKIQYQIDKNFIESFISSGKVLDVGCSGGFFLNVLSKKFKKYGVEIDKEAVKYARKTYSFGKNIICQDFLETSHSKEFFDLVIMRGVIEHLSDSVLAIKKVSQLLKPDGYYFIAATPNVDSFCANLYREKWNQFHPIRHIFYFSPKTLSKICSKYGLKLVATYFPYLETPYAKVEDDHREVLQVVQLKKTGRFDEKKRSPAFWGNMMNLVFKKF